MHVVYLSRTGVTAQNDYIRVDGTGGWIAFSFRRGVSMLELLHPHASRRNRVSVGGETQ